MKLEGLLVDLVPYGDRYLELEHKWHNGEGWFWATVGERHIVSAEATKRRQQERAEWRERHNPPRVTFGVQTKDGQPLGDFSFNWVLPHHRLSMLGTAICEPEFWGGGYGTDALLLAMDYAFDWLDLHKVWLMTMSLNVRVERQMAKVGFTLEARQRRIYYVDGEWADSLVYGLQREEWPGRDAVIQRIGLRAAQERA